MLDVNSSDEARVAPLRILVGADPDVLRCSVEGGLTDRIAARTDGEIAAVVDVLPVGRADSLLARVRADPTLFATVDVVVCS
ncbi:MAG TPA: hypothetical protein VFX21_10575, partial [Acidimicrobiia bacterium]|nr:hypothetical protein [Acidimicrobiia bacterium]